MKVTEVPLNEEALANLRGRFFLLVDHSGDGCWLWKGPRHSSGRGRYLWRAEDGGDGKYVMANRLSYLLATGELPPLLRNLCGNKLCVKASHYWRKPTGRWKPKVMKAIRGRVRQLSTEEIRHVRLLATLSHDEEEIGKQFSLTKRQIAAIALGRVRPEAGGRIRSSRFKGIRYYNQQFEQELASLRPDEPVVPHSPVDLGPQVARTPSNRLPGRPVSPGETFPFRAYGQGRRSLPRTGRW
jgi:hypothetical protein